jgi:hypothetical protein
MPLILGANTLTAGGYEVDNSLRFNSGSSDSLTKTTTTPDNRDKLTLSAWFKISSSSTSQEIFGFYGSNDYFTVRASNSNSIDVILYDGSTIGRLITTQLLRDFSAWYHIVVVVDSANATADDRMKIYLNGNQITSFSTRTNPSQNQDFILSTLTTTGIGINTDQVGGVSRFNGYISEAFYIDNQALDPTDFGEFDSDTGIWKPIAYTGTYGTAGFYLEFKDSSALGDDTSGNTNDFTVNNLTSADQTTDTPTNNFATLNPLGFAGTIPTFSQGNLNVVCGSGVSLYSVSTIGVSSGKWYVEGEIEQATVDGGLYYIDFGFADRADSAGTSLYVTNPGRFFWHSSWDGKINYRNNGSTTTGLVTGLATFVPGDFFQLYLDMDNELMYWGKNGSLLNSTGVSFNGKESLTGEYFFAFGDQFTSGTHEYAVNFGQGSIDGVGVSAYQDVNGFGSFKYNPTVTTDEGSKDFLALCTKNLAEYG